MLGGESTDIEEFSGMFNAAVSGTSISMIPQYIDSVFVGEPEESRYARIKTLYVVGSDERVMPPPRKDQGIIGEKECKEWDIEIYPSRKLSANLDKLALLQLLIKPEKALNVSYSMHSEKNEFLNPSSIIKQFQSIFNIEIESAESVYKDNYSVSEEERAELYGARFSTEENGVRELSEGMRRMRAGQLTNIDIKPFDALYSLTNGDRKARIGLIDAFGRSGKEVGQGALLERSGDKTSVSRLESYFACPFMHYAKYGIGARKREEAVIEADVRGTFIHTALELIVKRIMNKPAGFESSENEIADIRRNVIEELIDSPEYSRLISSSDRPLIIAGTERAVQYMLFAVRKSGFKPFLVEERIGGINIPSPIMNFGTDGRVALVGKIDRIDRLDNKVIVIDYKTGKVQDLATDLYYGKKIQLFIYLYALQDIGYEPVGALYMKLKDEFRKEKNETFYQGIIAVEELETFDPPVGEALLDQKESAEGSLIYNLMEYSRSVASGALNEIYNGYYENRPLTGTCGYCDYKDICFARMNEPNIRKSGKVKADETVFKGDRDA
jgi:ATP-dependent helicase/nuclease subunit B